MKRFSLLALCLAAAHACPYLAQEEEQQGQRKSNQNIRRIQVVNKPTHVDEAIQMATTQIQQIITDIEGMEAKFLRLSFHDCVGGCDGCVDLASPSNFGLKAPIDVLEPVVQHNGAFLTTGDVWALAGLVASRVTQTDTTARFPLQFVGRPKCAGGATTAGPKRVLPGAHFTTKQVVSFFQREFGYSADQTVAILGAHTLGKAASVNSGFTGEGGWDKHPDRLTNEYYRELLKFDQFDLTLEDNTEFPPFPAQFYWEEHEGEGEAEVSGIFMLHADMALAFDMQGYLNPANGAVNCTIVQQPGQTLCPTSPLRARAQLYSNDNALWVRDYEAALLKMVNKGCGNGVCTAVGGRSTPVAVPVPSPVAAPVKPYCNWGPLGTGASSTCDGQVQGGDWCNAAMGNCQQGCGGRWCTAVLPPVPPPQSPDGYCNWGPLGTAASSTCNGEVQGGAWCNAGSSNCQNGCRGKWCTTVVKPSPVPLSGGYCNWGPLGTGASSICDGQKQGGDWCNVGRDNCQTGCGGRWCGA